MTAIPFRRLPDVLHRRARPAGAPARPAWLERRWVKGSITAGAFVLYAGAGLWLLYSLDYAIGDSLARSAHARYVVASRDPHLAAIGFVWMPLPSLAQLPLSYVLGLFDHAAAAGPIASAAFAALTIPVLTRLLGELRVRPGPALALLAIYAFNPVTTFYAANGMSESFFFFFAALSCLGYVRWLRRGDAVQLGVLGLGLAGAMLVRYETIAMVAVFALAAAARAPAGRRLLPAMVVALPAAYVFFLWIAMSYILLQDPFFFARGLAHSARPPDAAPWLPEDRTIVTGIAYAARLSVLFGPGLLALGGLLFAKEARQLLARRSLSALEASPITAAAAVFPGSIVFLMARNATWGNPRYFAPLALFAAVLAAWILRDTSSPREWKAHGGAARLLAVPAVALSFVTGTIGLADPRVAAIESEPRVFGPLLGREDPSSGGGQNALQRWRALTRALDARLGERDLVLADTGVAFPAVLFTRHPEQFVIPPDRDFEQLVMSPRRRITYVIASASQGRPASAITGVLATPAPGRRWVEIGDFDVAKLYRLAPSPPEAPSGEGASGAERPNP